jgi:Ni,Fe-hydrogenase III large subunit
MTDANPLIHVLWRDGAGLGPSTGWPRTLLDAVGWTQMAQGLRDGQLELVSVWGEPGRVHAAVREGDAAGVFTLRCDPHGVYPSLGRVHPPAIRLERALQDLVGLVPEGLPDPRAWLDHGRWPIRHPLGSASGPNGPAPYVFLPVEGEGLHQVAVGPVHAGTIEPGHFRFTANGETVVRLEQRLGYAHKGTARLMVGAPLATAARLAGRISGDSTVAYAYAFARAVEAADGVEAPRRAQWLRALMAELERLANHLGDIGAVCNDAAFAILHAHFGVLREQVLRASNVAFGHRLMMDRIVPGGVTTDLEEGGLKALVRVAATTRKALPRLTEVYDETNSLQDRTVGTGIVRAEWVRQFAAGGFIGRASGRPFDARRWRPYERYQGLAFEPPVLREGDVNARVWLRIREVEQILRMLDDLLADWPSGPIRTEFETADMTALREGAAMVEGFRGDIFLWVRLAADGTVTACHFRDPSWFQWPLLEAAIQDNILADFPLCNKSFNCAYSGHDG